MKNDNLKKVAILSTAFILSASLFNFGPVSFKVLPQTPTVYAASSDDLKTKINNVLSVVNSDDKLRPAYNAARTEITDTMNELHISQALPNLNAKGVSASQAIALRNFLSEVIDYTQFSSTGFNSTVLASLNSEFGINVSVEDVSAILLNTQQSIIDEVKSQNLADFDLDLLSSLVIDALTDEVNDAWSDNTSLINGLKTIYGSDVADVTADLTTLKSTIASEADNTVLKKGSAALAIGYAKHYISSNKATAILTTESGQTISITKVSVEGVTVPLSMLSWSDSTNNTTYDSDNNKVNFSYSGLSTSGSTVVQGKLGRIFNSLGFADVVLVETTLAYSISGGSGNGGGGGFIPPVTDNKEEAAVTLPAVNENVVKDSQELAELESIVPTSNAEVKELANAVNKLVDVTVKIAAPAGTSGGTNQTANLVISENSFSDAFLVDFAKNIVEVKNRVDGKVDVKPNITLDAAELSNVSAEIPASLINKLVNQGVATITLKTADGEITYPISQTSTNITITVTSKEEEEDVQYVPTGNSNTFNIQPGYSNILTISGFDGHYTALSFSLFGESAAPATLARGNSATPVVAASKAITVNTKSKLTVAKVNDKNEVSLIASKYNAETNKVEAYITEPGSYVVVSVDADFKDISSLAWAADAIKDGARQGIFQGRGNNEFKPKEGVTKAEYITILLRTFNLTASDEATKDVKFADVKSSNWYFNSVAGGLQYGIISHDSDKFDPNKLLTREEMADLTAKLLVNTFGLKNTYEATNAFKVDGHLIDEKYAASVQFVTNEGIFNGKSEGVFDPKGNVTRAEAAVVALRLQNAR